jgi:hypothetical protein
MASIHWDRDTLIHWEAKGSHPSMWIALAWNLKPHKSAEKSN